MVECNDRPKDFCFPKPSPLMRSSSTTVSALLPNGVQELLFEQGVEVSHETVRVWCAKFGPDLDEALRHRKSRRGRTWRLDEMRVVLGRVTQWLWRAVNEHGEVLDV